VDNRPDPVGRSDLIIFLQTAKLSSAESFG
jgi:hypothetical protein